MAGIQAVGRHLIAAHAAGLRAGGVYDVAEERFVRDALIRIGRDASALPAAGFFRCEADLEDEFIRALGVDGVMAVVDAEWERRSFERLRQMPAQRAWPDERVLHRFLGVRAGRKHRYGRLLAEAVPLDRVPPPLDAALTWASAPGGPGGAR
ncbi:ATP-dependent endonuclease [Microbacterium sp. MEC084]|uniref:ATP-dependent endonuclease n=1 Tax=Microbacterium sp. MEC084 TaxID=1963027 RepID=UPI00106F3B50|nr:ATP-dependent endonuclease [Microbacterium sp. MEC084]MCD1267329.1 ATP-dependent endonuclease [Microbacterium sp. MEC084]